MNTAQSLQETIEAAASAIKGQNLAEADRLFEAALPNVSSMAEFFLAFAKLFCKYGLWERAAVCARNAIEAGLPPNHLAVVSAILGLALSSAQSNAVIRAEYDRGRGYLDILANSAPERRIRETIYDATLQLSVCASDVALSEATFRAWFTDSPWMHLPVASSPFLDVKTWCERHGAPWRQMDPAQRFASHRSGAGLESWDYESLPYNIASIPNGECLSGFDFVVAPTGEILSDSGYHPLSIAFRTWFPCATVNIAHRVIHLWAGEVEYVDAEALFLSCPEQMAVGHWMVDFLPRLRALSVQPGLKVAIPAEMPQKSLDLLTLFGISEERIIRCNLGRRYRFRQLVVAQPGDALRPSPENVRFVGDAVRKPPDKSHPSRIFLKRDTATRNIVNQDEFDREIGRLGFEQLNLAAMSIAEQRDRLADAEIVIATYGSDLLAFYFMQQGADLIELSWGPTYNAATGPYCNVLGLNYHAFACREAGPSRYRTLRKDYDFTVDCQALGGLLAGIIERKRSPRIS